MSEHEHEEAQKTEHQDQLHDQYGMRLGYLQSKVEEIHEDLKDHSNREEQYLVDLGHRFKLIEDEHAAWKTMLSFGKILIVGLLAFITFEWTTLRDNILRFFGR